MTMSYFLPKTKYWKMSILSPTVLSYPDRLNNEVLPISLMTISSTNINQDLTNNVDDYILFFFDDKLLEIYPCFPDKFDDEVLFISTWWTNINCNLTDDVNDYVLLFVLRWLTTEDIPMLSPTRSWWFGRQTLCTYPDKFDDEVLFISFMTTWID